MPCCTCRNKADAFLQGLKKEYDARHRHSRATFSTDMPSAKLPSSEHAHGSFPSSFSGVSHQHSLRHGQLDLRDDQSYATEQREQQWRNGDLDNRQDSSQLRPQRAPESNLVQHDSVRQKPRIQVYWKLLAQLLCTWLGYSCV